MLVVGAFGATTAALLAACGEDAPTPTATATPEAVADPSVTADAVPTSTATSAPTATTTAAPRPEPTATPAPEATRGTAATSTPAALTATATPTPGLTAAPSPTVVAVGRPTAAPTPTPRGTATPTPTPTATPTPTPELLFSPLTGLPISKEALARRVVAVKIDNALGARPQSGLGEAGVVYEHETEGSVTRYTAFFLDSELDQVGPIRSARFVDRDLVRQFDALFAHVGGSPPVLEDLRSSTAADMDEFLFPSNSPYERITSRSPPVNMYASLKRLRELGAARHQEQRAIESLDFYRDPQDIGPLRSVTVPRGPRTAYQAEYNYQPIAGRWERTLGGTTDIDLATGKALAVENVVIQHVEIEVTQFIEDSLGSLSLAIPTVGSGPATVFRDGLRFDGTWERREVEDVTQFRTRLGGRLQLRPGRTWVHVLDVDQVVDSA